METKYGMKDVHICKVEIEDEFEANPEEISEEEIPF